MRNATLDCRHRGRQRLAEILAAENLALEIRLVQQGAETIVVGLFQSQQLRERLFGHYRHAQLPVNRGLRFSRKALTAS